MDGKDWATLALASIGAALGSFNTYRAYIRDQPRLVIKAEFEQVKSTTKRLRIDLINTGTMTIAIDNVRILSSDVDYPHPAFIEERQTMFPYKLEPGARLTMRSRPEATAFDAPFMRKVYGIMAITIDGRGFKVKSPMLRRHADQLKRAARAKKI